jgi:hypothetical protein
LGHGKVRRLWLGGFRLPLGLFRQSFQRVLLLLPEKVVAESARGREEQHEDGEQPADVGGPPHGHRPP